MPESVDDPVFGPLDWEESPEWWVGAITFAPGHQVDVFVVPDFESPHPEAEIALARLSLARVRQRELEIRRWSADQLFAKRWNKVRQMSADDIADLLCVASLEFGPNGVTRVFWNDRDVLFGGHNVVTDLDALGECVYSGMQ
jgi:hypothetical protein